MNTGINDSYCVSPVTEGGEWHHDALSRALWVWSGVNKVGNEFQTSKPITTGPGSYLTLSSCSNAEIQGKDQ